MSSRQGPPKHQNSYAWKPNAGRKINETELGGKLRPLSEITGVCPRCRDQIDWKRKYGKYKPLVEPAKCVGRGQFVKLTITSAQENGVCAKCCCKVEKIIGRDISEVEAEQKSLQEAIKNARERERRTLLRAMNKGNSSGGGNVPKIADRSREGELFSATTIDEYAELAREGDSDLDEDDLVCNCDEQRIISVENTKLKEIQSQN